MADIDKSLPNVARPEDEITKDIEIEEVEETGQGPVEITDEEDGGAQCCKTGRRNYRRY